MGLTLLEASKLMPGQTLRQAVIQLFAMNTDILRVLPFTDIPGDSYKYNQEDTLPGVAFRAVNGSYTPSTGVINPQVESLVICGGELDVDTAIIKTKGPGVRATHENMKVKALAHSFSNTFIKGDSVTNPNEFDGLQIRLVGNQKISAGDTSGGEPLPLVKLDEAIDATDEPNYMLMMKLVRRQLSAAARNSAVGGYITYSQDEFGRRVTQYNDLPILIADGNADLYATLAANEASEVGGASNNTSIYILSLQDGYLSGIQNGIMEVRDLGELQASPAMRTRVEWLPGILLEHPRAATRLWSILPTAAVTAV